MNIDAFLPLLLKGDNNADMLKILTAIKSGDKSKAIEALMPKDKKNDQLMSILKMANTGNNKKPSAGLGAIEGFASNEILGMLVRYYAQ
ncbi:MAG: hypothetical protein J1F36_04115 [Clostridiales bacterium]|nr:hypothetical protein [Clostridiales bacterium]